MSVAIAKVKSAWEVTTGTWSSSAGWSYLKSMRGVRTLTNLASKGSQVDLPSFLCSREGMGSKMKGKKKWHFVSEKLWRRAQPPDPSRFLFVIIVSKPQC
jgi:hypothetical protein